MNVLAADTAQLLHLATEDAKKSGRRLREPNAKGKARRQLEQLWRSEERFRLLVEGVEEYAIFMLDPRGVVATWNVGAERINGYRASEIIGKHFSVFRTEEEVRSGVCERELAVAAERGKLVQEGWRVRKDGSRFWASVLLTSLHRPSGELVGFAKITHDLTQRRQLDEERVQKARAEEAVRLRDEFLLIASHELKTPLAVLHIDLHGLLHHQGDADKQRRRLERAKHNVERLNDLVDSLLSVSRLTEGRMELQRGPMDLRQAVVQVVDTMQEQAARAGCELRLVAQDAPVMGTWDRLRIEQVVMSLLANACKYGAGAPVTVSLASGEREAVLVVRDRGPGVPAVALQRIFDRFERASSIRHFGGLGLGLYISRQIVSAHGGVIAAENHAEGGAELTVRLPLSGGEDGHHGAPG